MIPRSVRLQTCLSDAEFPPGCDLRVTRVSCDSRSVSSGALFVAVPGTEHDGHDYLRDAVAAGAGAVVVERPADRLAVPQIVVKSSVRAWNRVCMALQGNPQDQLCTVGITGTNGKTTTSWLLRNILAAAGYPAGLLGTVEYSDGIRQSSSRLTTPDGQVQAELMASMVSQGVRHCVMEVSSHALVQHRCSGVQFTAAAITNITHDHLDYHRTIDDYRAAKARISERLHCDAPLLLNGDDQETRRLLEDRTLSCPVITYGSHQSCELRYAVLTRTHRSQRLRLSLAQGDVDVRVRLIGDHNASNCMAAAGLAEQLGISLPSIVRGLESTRDVPGRLERIDEEQPFQVFVDYAHTPDALRRCLETVRAFTHGDLICVFGAGGERDEEKRPKMARAAAAADRVFLTSDNPRSESPSQIIGHILQGFSTRRHVDVDTDRRAAIRRALQRAQPGDAVVIAGKGHEGSQVIGDQSLPFDDRRVARQILRELTHPLADGEHAMPGLRTAAGLVSFPG